MGLKVAIWATTMAISIQGVSHMGVFAHVHYVINEKDYLVSPPLFLNNREIFSLKKNNTILKDVCLCLLSVFSFLGGQLKCTTFNDFSLGKGNDSKIPF